MFFAKRFEFKLKAEVYSSFVRKSQVASLALIY